MPRSLQSVLVLSSALACACLAALWAASYWGGIIAAPLSAAPGAARFLVIGGGRMFLVTQRAHGASDGSWVADVGRYGALDVRSGGVSVAEVTSSGSVPPGGPLGFSTFSTPGPAVRFQTPAGSVATCSVVTSGFGAPLWVLLVVTGVLPAASAAREVRRRRTTARARSGLCTSCGYDLRASPERCPECGRVPAIAVQPT
jgi:hypothetical protein